uniref:Dynein heavy chain coiled coil stalk domain-containing protein n=1 Tax=Knipowitschia caucasica TaxID=637954 RepID=A0AAV2LM78_KNICA
MQEQGSVLGAIADLELQLEESQNIIVREQTRLTELEKQLQETQQEVQAALEARIRKVSCLELSALEEVRGYRDPPEPVTMVMDAVCLLFHHPPGWDSAKHLLSLNSFFQELEFFDHRRVSTQQLQELATLVHSPAFDPEVVAEASQACAQLCHWVLAVYECCKLHPYVKSSRRIETEAAAALKHLQLARRLKEEQSRQLKILTHQLESVREQLWQHTEELLQAERVHREATCTVDELGTSVSVWKRDVQRAVTAMETLPGDTLLTAAIISYLGPFGADTRCELLAKWRGLCMTGRLCPAPECSQCGSLAAPLVPVSSLPHGPLCQALGVSERPLQAEALSDLLLSVLLSSCSHNCVQRCPLLVDPEHRLDPHQPHSCFRGDHIMALKDFDVDLCADDPHLLDKLEEAVRTGALVFVRAAERSPSCPRLLSIVSQAYFSLTFYTTLPAHMLTTEMAGPLLCRLHVVDLSLSTLEVERCLQSQLLPPDGRLILSQQKRLEQSRQLLIEKLSSIER